MPDKAAEKKPGYTSETWLSPEDPQFTYGDILPYAFKPDLSGAPVPGTVSWAVPNFAREAVNNLALTLAAPRNAFLGKYTPEEMKERVAPAMTSTLLGLGVGIPAPANSSRIFAGTQSRALPPGLGAAANEHLDAVLSGVEDSPEVKNSIWKKTGWYKDVDGRWKYEISDRDSKLNFDKVMTPHGVANQRNDLVGAKAPLGWDKADASFVGLPTDKSTPLGDILEHENLFKAYPWMQELPVWGKRSGSAAGTYHPDEHAISLRALPAGQFHSALLHEVQHAVQHFEDFGFGGNVDMFLPKDFNEKYTAKQALMRELRDKASVELWHPNRGPVETISQYLKGEPLSEIEWRSIENLQEKQPEVFESLKKEIPALRKMHQAHSDAYENYLGLAGETEARNVQERWDRGHGAELHPHATPGYPKGKQILIFPEPWINHNKSHPELSGRHEFEPVEHDPFSGKKIDWEDFLGEDVGGWP